MLSPMDQNPHPQTYYIHDNFQKFWEITIDPSSNSTEERFGNINAHGQQDLTTTQTNTQFHNSWEEALNAAHTLIRQKTSEGFGSFDKLNTSLTDIALTTSIIQSTEENPTTSELMNLENPRSKKLKRKPKEDLVRDDQKMVKKSNNQPAEDKTDSLSSKVVNFFKNLFTFQSEDHVKIELPISTRVYRQATAIERKAEGLNLKCKIYEDALVVEGDARKVDWFEYFLKDLAQENEKKEVELSNLSKEMSHKILQRAKILNVYCEFFEKKLVMRGSQEHLDELADYIGELEVTFQNSTLIITEEGEIQPMIESHTSNVKKIVQAVKKETELIPSEKNEKMALSKKIQMERELRELEKTREKYVFLGSKILEFYTPLGYFVPKAQHRILEN
jgi:predicted DNA-binding WGR domain protein